MEAMWSEPVGSLPSGLVWIKQLHRGKLHYFSPNMYARMHHGMGSTYGQEMDAQPFPALQMP